MKLLLTLLSLSTLSLFYSNSTVGNKETIIQSNLLQVSVDKSFPRIIKYLWQSSGEVLYGQTEPLKIIKINNKEYKPEVSSSVLESKINYILDIADIDLRLQIQIEVVDDMVKFEFTKIIENGSFKVHSIEIPNHNILTINSTEKLASFAGSKMYTAVEGNGDTFQLLNRKTEVDSAAQGYLYAILNHEALAACLWTNAVEEKTDKNRIKKQTIQKNKYLQTGIWSGSWIYRAEGMRATDPLPKVKIVITSDRNNDKMVDWQDGAIAYRKILNNPPGVKEIPKLIVQRIPMNFASQATNPFTKTLDETKRIFLNTDGLGQYVILKGYGSEGHDSKHPDYGDIGKRQGGAEEMNILCNAAPDYKALIGVHINGTESYPEASAFNETLIKKDKRGWNWLDQAYYMDKRYDASSNNRLLRLKSLKKQVPGLDFTYVDVWYGKGSWDSRQLGRELRSLDLIMTTEFPQDHEYDAIWNHWAVDYKYGGKKIKGYNSKIVRFIRNHQKDTWIAKHPILGGTEMEDFEGWQSRINYDKCIKMSFETNLPTKYLQHFQIMKWQNNSIFFENGVEAHNSSKNRIIKKDGKIICNGGTYLLPWNPNTEEKMYHWNAAGGTTSWSLPNSWAEINYVFLYELTDKGKQFKDKISVSNGKISLAAKPSIPYVIYKAEASVNKEMNWGEGTFIKDPGFNNGDLKYWEVKGDGAVVKRNKNGQYQLEINKSEGTTISQNINTLSKGHYFVSAYVSTNGNRKATLGVLHEGKEISNFAKNSLWTNFIAADSKHGTKMQRIYVHFDMKNHHDSVKLFLKAGKGDSIVKFDDVRLKQIGNEPSPDSLYFKETFEHIPSGIYPFVKGSAGGINDPRIHLSQLHSPYTQKGWNGKKVDDVINGNWSLKIHEDVKGIIVQTIPQTIRFQAGKKYTVKFKYQAEASNYSFLIGEGNKILTSVLISPQYNTTEYSATFIAGNSGNSWIGIEKVTKKTSDLIIDDLIIIEEDLKEKKK